MALRLLSQPATRGFSSAYRASLRTRNTPPWSIPRHIRCATVQAGVRKSGHITPDANETLIFFDNVYPLRFRWLLRFPWQSDRNLPKSVARVAAPGVLSYDPSRLIEKSKLKEQGVEVKEIIPRLNEGAAFVKIAYGPEQTATEIEDVLGKYLKEHTSSPWWNPLRRMRADIVRGKPWVEDLFRFPSSRIEVEFLPAESGGSATEMSQEQLYALFRHYGKLTDIMSQPTDSKIVPRYALLDFTSIRRAISAKNCMHGYTVSEAEGGGKGGTSLRLSYQEKDKGHWTRDWLFSHPRIVIPLLVAIATGITVVIFDPIRTFFIRAHVTRKFHIEDNSIFTWFKAQAIDILSFQRRRESDSGMEAIWDDRRPHIEQIQTWLMETADTFIIVQGPRGSGKRELIIDQALRDRKNKLVIDCKPIQEAHGDSATIRAAAEQVRYRPIFSWMNSISGMVDLAAQGAAGVKTGFSETLDTQLSKIWNNTAIALKQIALEGRKKDDKDANLSDDEYLDAHPEKRPVVIIDNFLHRSNENNTVYDKMAEWAAGLTAANIAHVIFLTNNVSFSKSLSKALPDRVFRQISLSDCSPEVAKRFVINQLKMSDSDEVASSEGVEKKPSPESMKPRDLSELDSCIDSLGGRLTDLEFLARRIQGGETPRNAVREIINQSASEILKMYIFGMEDSTRRWTPEQAWTLIAKLAQQPDIRYNELLLDTKFSSDGESVIHALEHAELITVVSANGRPYAIRPGKPVYQPAFKRLTDDKVLKSRLDLAILADSIKTETANIEKYEKELTVLGELPKQPSEVGPRVNWLLKKLKASQVKIEAMDAESTKLKRVLQEEY
ncbi:hypothetical protein P152DRAFT_459843 [Eremomyces bilateralis CBS 781.70]|uniref:Mitochondrial escape protein 2 n=1 Tax=Eremomyces bilateralis CBS 781.70 TaxID=1392243 RepID=A0A6G1FZ27_9PEZI|nr:uncharacterized protein P152DRAFT_459843 [Eremomyces bilateralis CBS 781.70]KAF1810972.1 hypothetical protein P152DRAFT_459843 [Eremomyces bilateralis CBS 781.70]